jgi:hypothetical protein
VLQAEQLSPIDKSTNRTANNLKLVLQAEQLSPIDKSINRTANKLKPVLQAEGLSPIEKSIKKMQIACAATEQLSPINKFKINQ